MLDAIFAVLYMTIPALLLVFLGISLYRYASARKREKRAPGSVSPQVLKNRRNTLIVAATLVGVMLVVFVGFMILLILSIAYM